MDRRTKTLPPTTVTFSPNFERSDEGSNYLLRVNLQGFNRKDFSVQVDQTRKLTIKGRRQSEKNTYVLLDETYNLPQDSDYKKIVGKFDDGCLVLTIPKMVKPMAEEKKPNEINQEPLKPLPSIDSKKIEQGEKQDALQVDKMEKIEGSKKVADEISPPKTSTPTLEKKIEEKEKVAADQILQPKTSPPTHDKKLEEREKVAADQIPQPMTSPPPTHEKKLEEREKVAADQISQTKVSPSNEKKSDHIQDEGSKEKITDDQDEKKIGLLCKRKFREEGWLDHGMLDSLIERINNNKKVILVAVVAFSVGCYVSHKLRSSAK
ncbi:Small heat shock protein HSP20 protein [Dioscorea alata]|uniref:Small heat shock protein HSP20 protein n=1 Tax=Dioscorea alata TaxID=55571 RepID=A0ACB7WFR4_DIOAL|nr:Small heat shock protein HSP20 protein [Dioscorea alata]